MWPILNDISLPTFEAYGRAQGYDVLAVPIQQDGSTPREAAAEAARWHKINLIREALQLHPTVVWLDADTVVCREDEDIALHVPAGNFQGFALEQVPRYQRMHPNSGVWVMHQSDMSFAFLDAVQQAGKQPGPFADQGAIMKVLGWNMGDPIDHRGAKPGEGSPYLSATAWLPPGWNQPYLERTEKAALYADRPRVDDPHLIHFMGMDHQTRRIEMERLVMRMATRQIMAQEDLSPVNN